MSLWDSLFNFFKNNIFITSPSLSGSYKFLTGSVTIGGKTLETHEYLCCFATLISIIFILVLCCLFVYKIIKLVGNLIK